jgi:Kef-type K+ transport system membrane component KefB/nucleotide-binding universal stress UspA family protein
MSQLISRNGALRRASVFLICCIGAPALSAGASVAGPAFPGHSADVIFLGELVLLMLAGRLLGEALTRVGQPSVMGMLLAGILLGPSFLGAFWPDLQQTLFPKSEAQKAMLDGVAQFGILLLLLLTGMEIDLRLVRSVGRAALAVSASGVLVPFACGFALGQFVPAALLPHPDQRLVTSLFLGTALSISSIKIVAAIVREMGFSRRNLGQIIVASAICEDSIGWIIIAITFSLAEAGAVDVISVGKAVLGTLLFLVLSFTIGRRLVFLAIRWANDNFQSEFPVITTILVIMGISALITHFLGVHTVLGAFVAGVLVGESPILSRHIDDQLRGLIVAFFMPVFFGISGLSADLTVLRHADLAVLTAIVIAIASFGKFAGAFIGGKLGGLTRAEALALGCGMNARGSTEVIVASIGLSMGALSQNLFTIILVMAIITTLGMPPMLRWSLARLPLRKSERERLDREEFDARGFVANIERLLLAVDESENGKFTARIAGLIAGKRHLVATVLPLEDTGADEGGGKADAGKIVASAEVLRTAAESVQSADGDRLLSSSVEISVRRPEASAKEAVKTESEKGYDLLFAGIEQARTRTGGFHQDMAELVSSFEGALAIVVQGTKQVESPGAIDNILIPVNGTDVSVRGAELAMALAQACRASVTALYVTNKTARPAQRPRRARLRAEVSAIAAELDRMARRYDVTLKTEVRRDAMPDEAILAQAQSANYDLLVMGVSRRPGEKLFLGETAAAVLQHAPSAVLFLAT